MRKSLKAIVLLAPLALGACDVNQFARAGARLDAESKRCDALPGQYRADCLADVIRQRDALAAKAGYGGWSVEDFDEARSIQSYNKAVDYLAAKDDNYWNNAGHDYPVDVSRFVTYKRR